MAEPDENTLNEFFEKGFNEETISQSAEAAGIAGAQNPEFIKEVSKIIDKVFEKSISAESFNLDNKLRIEIANALSSLSGENVSADNPLLNEVGKEFIAIIMERGRQGIITKKPFLFNQNERSELIHITGIDNPKFIKALEDITSVFLHLRKSSADMPKLTEVKAALGRLSLKAKALKDDLTMIDTQPKAYEPLAISLKLRDRHFLASLNEQLNIFLTAIEIAKALCRDSRIKWPQQRLAIEMAGLLNKHNVKPNKYRDGAFNKCLKLVLQATKSAAPDDPYTGKEPDPLNIIRTVWPLLKVDETLASS